MKNNSIALKAVVIILSAALMMMFAGCRDNGQSGSSNTSESKNTDQSSQADSADRPYTNKEFDLKGRDVVVLMLGGSGSQYPNPDSDNYDDLVERIEYVENKYKCNIVFDTTYGFPEIHEYIVTNAISGLDVADIMYSLPWQTVEPYITKNIAVPLNDYLDFDNPNINQISLNNWGKFFGKNYIFCNSKNGVNCGMLYNKDIFERDNLEDPFELQQSGKWTWAKFLEICEKATKRDGEGKTTQWGVVTTSGSDFMTQLFASNNAEPLILQNDQFSVNFNDSKVIEVFEFMNEIVVQKKAGLLTELVLEAPERGDRTWKEGKAAMAFVSLGVAKQYSPKNCGFIIAPIGPSSSDYKTPAHSGPAFMVPSTTKDPEVSARIMYDLFALWDTSMPGHFSEEDFDNFNTWSGQYEKAFGENDLETFKLYIEKQNTDVMNFVRFNEIQNFLINCIYAPNVYLNVPLATSIEQWSAVARDTISNVNKSMQEMKDSDK